MKSKSLRPGSKRPSPVGRRTENLKPLDAVLAAHPRCSLAVTERGLGDGLGHPKIMVSPNTH